MGAPCAAHRTLREERCGEDGGAAAAWTPCEAPYAHAVWVDVWPFVGPGVKVGVWVWFFFFLVFRVVFVIVGRLFVLVLVVVFVIGVGPAQDAVFAFFFCFSGEVAFAAGLAEGYLAGDEGLDSGEPLGWRGGVVVAGFDPLLSIGGGCGEADGRVEGSKRRCGSFKRNGVDDEAGDGIIDGLRW